LATNKTGEIVAQFDGLQMSIYGCCEKHLKLQTLNSKLVCNRAKKLHHGSSESMVRHRI